MTRARPCHETICALRHAWRRARILACLRHGQAKRRHARAARTGAARSRYAEPVPTRSRIASFPSLRRSDQGCAQSVCSWHLGRAHEPPGLLTRWRCNRHEPRSQASLTSQSRAHADAQDADLRSGKVSRHQDLAAVTGVAVYFADPHAPAARLKRIPTACCATICPGPTAGLTQQELDAIAWKLNTRPRKLTASGRRRSL